MRDSIRTTRVLLFACLAGCFPRVGYVINIEQQTIIILDQRDYEEYDKLKSAGADTKQFTHFVGDSLTPKRKWKLLQEGSKVRVLEHLQGGLKVIVDRGMDLERRYSLGR
jgi:hypothetical protein